MANDWWHLRQEELQNVAGKGCPVYVYDEETLNETLFDLLSIDALNALFYPVHTNPHPKILRKAFEMDVGFKCISIDEITRVLNNFPRLSPQRILFVPGHAYGEDFERAFDYGANIAVKDLNTPKRWPGIFFHPLRDLNESIPSLAGSSRHFPEVSTLIFGNSMDVNINHEKEVMDIPGLGDRLETIKNACPQYRLWFELPDFMVSHAGALLAKVTEVGEEEGTRYIRVNMDMTDPLCERLHGACHRIINLAKRDDVEMAIKTRIIGHEEGQENTLDFMEAPASVNEGDLLLFTNMGRYEPGRDFDPKGRDSVPEHYMSARSMCQVKI